MTYRSEIDGLRAIAVMPVVLFHAGFDVFSGGFIGVDIFFVVSGYLITSLIIGDLSNSNFSLLSFYGRRIRRLLPAFILMLMMSMIAAWYFMLPEQLSNFADGMQYILLIASNFYFWQSTGYFAEAAELQPLLHTWSLAVEEQFYFILPIFLMCAWGLGKQKIFLTLLFTFILSLATSELAWRNSPSANFYLLPTRAWELLAGSLLALQRDKIRCTGLLSDFASILGFGMIVFSIFLFDFHVPSPSVYNVFPVIGTLLIIQYAHPGTIVNVILTNRLLVLIGLMSYSIYLWHQPIFAFSKIIINDNFSFEFNLLLIGITFLISYISWRFVEKSFRNVELVPTKFLVIGSISAIISIFILASIIKHYSGFIYSYPRYNTFIETIKWDETLNSEANCLARYGGDQYCVIADIERSPTDLLIGDSHANHFYPGLSKLIEGSSKNLLMFGAGGCPPFIDIDMGYHHKHGLKLECKRRTNQQLKHLLSKNSIKTVYIAFAHETLFDSRLEFTDELNQIDFHNNRQDAMIQALLRTINYARKYGKDVIYLQDLPDNTYGKFLRCLKWRNSQKSCIHEWQLTPYKPDYGKFVDDLKKHGVKVAILDKGLRHFPFTSEGDYLYRDETHLSYEGSIFVLSGLQLSK